MFNSLQQAPIFLEIGPNACILRGFALELADELLKNIDLINQLAPFRNMITPGGFEMSVAMTNCGPYGWVTDKNGYRYTAKDPLSGESWPFMPFIFSLLAKEAAKKAGFDNFYPDSCLINRYGPKSKLSLHQDKDEKNFKEPIVSISLGVPAIFLFGGIRRNEKPKEFELNHGDVVVWGGESRLYFHGIKPIKEATHSKTGQFRINLTFRKVF